MPIPAGVAYAHSRTRCTPSAIAGLTLIELLAVIAIIGVLAAITFGIAKGVQKRAAISKARVEMGAIGQALESFKLQYGDYPQTGNPGTMLQSLIGRRGPAGASMTSRALIEISRFTTVSDKDPFADPTAVLMDPFGKPYQYAYKTSAAWKNQSFVLYSSGPDGGVEGTIPPDGLITAAFESSYNSGTRTGNPDNIYHGRN